MMNTEMPQETQYQTMIRRGFKLIRPGLNPYRIEIKNKGNHKWTCIEKFDTLKKMTDRLIELGSQEKTIIYNE